MLSEAHIQSYIIVACLCCELTGTRENVCCSCTLGEPGHEWGSLQSLHMMRKPDMEELDASLEVTETWEDRDMAIRVRSATSRLQRGAV